MASAHDFEIKRVSSPSREGLKVGMGLGDIFGTHPHPSLPLEGEGALLLSRGMQVVIGM
jgi:hypothetical protein